MFSELNGNKTYLYETVNSTLRPIGFKIVSGTGISSDPFEIEFIFDMELTEATGIEPTCTENGHKPYFYGQYGEVCLYSDKSFTRLTDQNGDNTVNADDVILPALGHDYGDSTYEWSEDNSSCTKKKICKHDESHILTETAEAVLKTTERGAEYAEASFNENITKYAHTDNISNDGT